jgi:hypothetical protein
MSHPAGGKLQHLCLDRDNLGGHGEAITFAPFQGAPHLKTLLFFLYDNEPRSWWETLARMTPELSTLYITFMNEQVGEIHCVINTPSLVSPILSLDGRSTFGFC